MKMGRGVKITQHYVTSFIDDPIFEQEETILAGLRVKYFKPHCSYGSFTLGGSSKNDVTFLVRRGFRDDSTKAFVIKSVTMGERRSKISQTHLWT